MSSNSTIGVEDLDSIPNPEEIVESFIEFYQELFVSSNSTIGVEDLDSIPNIFSDEMNS